jgi:hypothetical protein
MVAEAKAQIAELVVGAAEKVLSETMTDAQRKKMLEAAAKHAAV